MSTEVYKGKPLTFHKSLQSHSCKPKSCLNEVSEANLLKHNQKPFNSNNKMIVSGLR